MSRFKSPWNTQCKCTWSSTSKSALKSGTSGWYPITLNQACPSSDNFYIQEETSKRRITYKLSSTTNTCVLEISNGKDGYQTQSDLMNAITSNQLFAYVNNIRKPFVIKENQITIDFGNSTGYLQGSGQAPPSEGVKNPSDSMTSSGNSGGSSQTPTPPQQPSSSDGQDGSEEDGSSQDGSSQDHSSEVDSGED